MKTDGGTRNVARRSGRAFARSFWFGRLSLCLLLCCSAFCLPYSAFSAPPATGAKIDESKVVKTYYVDAAGANAADDDEHGTQDAPFITIQRAVDAALRDKDANVGARIIIGSGTYREALHVGRGTAHPDADTDAPLIIEAAEHNQTIIDAADTVGWEAATWKREGNTLTHRWPFSKTKSGHGIAVSAPTAPEIYQRSELVVADGTVLQQVDSASSLSPGSFWAISEPDRKNPGVPGGMVRVQLPEDANAAEAAFQVGTRSYGLEIVGRRNLVVRGLLFQHAANPGWPHNGVGSSAQAGLGLSACSNVLIEDVLCQWNDGVGMFIEGGPAAPVSEGITLRRVQLVHNGGSGLVVMNLKNVLAEDCETSFNNFRGEWTSFADPQGPAGVKAHGVHGSTWRRQRAVANFSRGLWWSGDCTDLLVEDAVVHDNLFSGLLIENCPGPSVVRSCLIIGNRMLATSKPEVSQPAAVSFEASPDVTLENNLVAGNLMPQLGLRDVAERTDDVNFETGAHTTLRAERHVYRHNAFWGSDPTQTLVNLPVADRAGKGDFAFYYVTLDSDENCFWNPATPDVFCTYDRTSYHRPGMALAGWKMFLATHANAGNGGQGDRRPEAGSLWEDPRFMEPGEADYRLQAQSPLIDWGLPSEEGGAAQ